MWRDEFTEQYASSYFDLPRIDSETGGYSTKKQPELEFGIEALPHWESLVLEGFAPAQVPPQAQQSHQETPAPKTAPVTDPAGHEAKPASARRPYYRMGWQQTAAFEHVVNVYASIAPATAKQLCAELKKSAIGDTALGVRRGGLFVRETGKALNDKTIENSLPTIRIQAQKLPRESHFPAKHSRE